MDSRYRFLTLGTPWTQSMPSRDVNAVTRLAEASWWRDKLFKSGFAKFEPSSVKRNFGTSIWMVLHDLHDISAFGYYGSQMVDVVETECSKPAENHQTLIKNLLQETHPGTKHTKLRKN